MKLFHWHLETSFETLTESWKKFVMKTKRKKKKSLLGHHRHLPSNAELFPSVYLKVFCRDLNSSSK